MCDDVEPYTRTVPLATLAPGDDGGSDDGGAVWRGAVKAVCLQKMLACHNSAH